MFLGAYHFDGQPSELVAAYDRLVDMFPPNALLLNICTMTAMGITVFDACPTRTVFEAFSSSPDTLAAFEAAGLPAPRVELLGEVHNALLRPD